MIDALRSLDAIWQNHYGISDSCFAAVLSLWRPQLFGHAGLARKRKTKSVAESV